MRRALYAKIHIAKKELGLDDDTYRALLATATDGKDSLKKCSIKELESVLGVCRQKGFTPKPKKSTSPSKRMSPVSSARRVEEINMLRAVFIQMGVDGFINDASETALCKFVTRIAKVESPEWLTHETAPRTLEALKNWHLRLMVQKLTDDQGFVYIKGARNSSYQKVAKYYQSQYGAPNER